MTCIVGVKILFWFVAFQLKLLSEYELFTIHTKEPNDIQVHECIMKSVFVSYSYKNGKCKTQQVFI